MCVVVISSAIVPLALRTNEYMFACIYARPSFHRSRNLSKQLNGLSCFLKRKLFSDITRLYHMKIQSVSFRFRLFITPQMLLIQCDLRMLLMTDFSAFDWPKYVIMKQIVYTYSVVHIRRKMFCSIVSNHGPQQPRLDFGWLPCIWDSLSTPISSLDDLNDRVRTCWKNLDQKIIDKSIDHWRNLGFERG